MRLLVQVGNGCAELMDEQMRELTCDGSLRHQPPNHTRLGGDVAKKPKTAHYPIHQMTVEQFDRLFPNEDACKTYLVRHRWPDGVVRCPRCGFEAKAHGTKPFHWQCYNCAEQTSYRFSVLVDTVFENTNKTLRDWFRVIHMMTTSKKGVSALQV